MLLSVQLVRQLQRSLQDDNQISGGDMINLQILYRIFVPIFIFFLLLSCQKEQESVETIRPVRTKQVFSAGGGRSRAFTGVVY
jgi:hypothetical protein